MAEASIMQTASGGTGPPSARSQCSLAELPAMRCTRCSMLQRMDKNGYSALPALISIGVVIAELLQRVVALSLHNTTNS